VSGQLNKILGDHMNSFLKKQRKPLIIISVSALVCIFRFQMMDVGASELIQNVSHIDSKALDEYLVKVGQLQSEFQMNQM
jgi:hypothetical protein